MAEISKVAIAASEMSRKEKRKLLKKLKRKQIRRNVAVKDREICEAVANDEAEQERLRRLEEEEAERMERDRREFEAREREFLQRLEEKKRREEEEEEERRKRDEERDLANKGDEHESSEGDDWEYVEEGPAEIIWKGNEIIVKKTKVKVPKKVSNLLKEKQESERPISNPLAPQYEALEDYSTAQEVLKSVAQQVPNFGTEQDKAHCPFHLKTGVCRFGSRCSRVHFYPDKSCTLLIKNMYTGLGLAWEQDEGLECTDEEVERSFEEFYEDVHTEFLKFGEIENFKVCKNASSHLRGNVYVHYRLLESAVLAYQSINARYFARKQLSCEFVNLTRWKVAICGEYMKSRLKTCSRGSACNFIHCFRNPGGDYEWADWEKPAPRYWQKEMAALFGYSGGKFTDESVRYHLKRSRSRDPDSPHRKSPSNNIDYHRSRYLQGNRGESERKQSTPEYNRVKRRKTDSLDESYCSSDYQKSSRRNQNMTRESDLRLTRQSSINREHRVNAADESGKIKGGDRSLELKSRNSSKRKIDSESVHEHHHSSEKVSRFDVMKSPHVDRHHSKHHRHESEESLHKKKKSYSSDIDGLLREKDAHHSDKSLPIKEQSDLSDSSSNESKLGRDERSQNNRRNISSKSKPDYREYKRKSASLERDEGRCHNHSSNSSKAVSVLDGGRIDRDGKRRQRNRSRSKGSDYQSEFTDSEGERCKYRTDGRSHKSIKHRRQVKHEVESSGDASDDGRSLRYEKKPKKDRRTRSRSKNDFDFDVVSNVKRLNSNEIHHGSERSSDVLHNEESEGPVSTRDVKYYEMEPIAPINKTNDNPTTSQRVETDCELEQTYRMAALKKLEEKRKLKNALPVKSRKLNISAEIHVHENIAVENGEGSSREVGTSADSERRRI